MVEITQDEKRIRVTVKASDHGYKESGSVTDILLYSILGKLEEIRCGLIDIEINTDPRK